MKASGAATGAYRWRSWLWLMVALLGLFLLVAMALLHIVQPAWRGTYFYNGDSLTLALLMKSLRAGEPFHWVLSSQLFLFPEALVYALCSAITGSVRSALLINSAVALVLLYAGYGLVGRIVLQSRGAAHAFALLATALLVFYMLCEVTPQINGRTFTTLYLFNTYYYGAVLCGLLVLFWIVQALTNVSSHSQSSAGIVGPSSGIFVVTALTYFSDPLFFLQCSVPAIAALCLLYLGRLVVRRAFIWLVVSQVAGLLLGSVGRSFCKEYIGSPVVKYFDFRNISQGFRFLAGVFDGLERAPAAFFEYGLLTSCLILALVAVGIGCRRWWRERMSTSKCSHSVDMLVALFALGSPVSSIAGALITGNAWTRYWLPLTVFPVLAVLPLGRRFMQMSAEKVLVTVVVIIAVAAWFYGPVLYQRGIQQARPEIEFADVHCYNSIMSHGPFNTVGGFWTTRPLDLYSDTDSRSLQVGSDLHMLAWMNNRAPYSILKFNGVVVDRRAKRESLPNHVYAGDIQFLGPYSKKFVCPSFDIYYYDTDSPGYVRLNQTIEQ